MKKTRFWLSVAAALTGGACIVVGPAVQAENPGLEPPASLRSGDAHVRSVPTPAPVVPDHFDNGPCWQDEMAVDGDCPWMNDTDEAWSYRYNAYQDKYAGDYQSVASDAAVESEETTAGEEEADGSQETRTEDSYGYACDYDACCFGDDENECVAEYEAAAQSDDEVAETDPAACDQEYDCYWEDDYCNYGEEAYDDGSDWEADYYDYEDVYDDGSDWEDGYYDYEDVYDEDAWTEETPLADAEPNYGFEDEYSPEDWYCVNDECDVDEAPAPVEEAVVDDEYTDEQYGYYDYGEYDGYGDEYGPYDGYDNEEYMDETYTSDEYGDVYEYDYEYDATDNDSGSWEEDSEDEYDYYEDDYDSYSYEETEPETDAAQNEWSYDYYDEEGYGYEGSYEENYEENYEDESYSYEEDYTYEEEYGYDEGRDYDQGYGYEESYGYDDGYSYDEPTYEGYSDAYPYEEYAYPADEDDMAASYSDEGVQDEESDDVEATSDVTDWSQDDDRDYAEMYEYEHSLRGGYDYEVPYGDVTDEVDPYDAAADEEALYDAEMYEYEASNVVDESADAQAEASSTPPSDPQLSGDVTLLFSQPATLLPQADQELLRTLQQLAGDKSRLRRARFAEHLEGLGWQAIDFAFRFEDATGREVLGLSGDLPAAAAFLAAYRMVERGDVAMDAGVASLAGTLDDVSLDWIEGVDQITADAYQTWDDQQLARSATEPAPTLAPAQLRTPAIEAVVSLATKKLGALGDKILELKETLSQLGWSPVLAEPTEESPFSQAAAPETPVKR